MKKSIQHIAILLIAFAVFFTGAGVTVVNYCCSTCETVVASQTDHACCFEDGLDHQHVCDCTSHSSQEEHQCATTERLTIDLDNSSSKPQLAPLSTLLAHDFIHVCVSCAAQYEYNSQTDTYDDPPVMPTRSYLSLIRVLII